MYWDTPVYPVWWYNQPFKFNFEVKQRALLFSLFDCDFGAHIHELEIGGIIILNNTAENKLSFNSDPVIIEDGYMFKNIFRVH